MNSFHNAVALITGILKTQGDVHTIICKKGIDPDLYKKDIYPLAHIIPQNAQMSSSQINTFTFELAVMDQRDISTHFIDNKDEDSNELYNYNTCYNVINYLITYLRLRNNDYGFELVNVQDPTFFDLDYHNGLDGIVVTFTIACPNSNISVC